MVHKQKAFKTFPEFSELSIREYDKYSELIADYPPISEISFSSLMSWWSSLENCKVSLLNNNLVISYWLPGDDRNSGLSIIGKDKIDESICEIFDYQKLQGKECKLVHVPEFTLENVTYPDLFSCSEESDYNESIVPVLPFANFNTLPLFVRLRIGSFLKATKNDIVTLRRVDLSKEKNKELIIDCYHEWKTRKRAMIANALPLHAEQAFIASIKNAERLNQEALCLYVGDTIHSFTIFETPAHPDYKILKYSGFSCEITGAYEYVIFKLAELFESQNVKYVNIAIHIGDPKYKIHKIALRPINTFRKFTIEPNVAGSGIRSSMQQLTDLSKN